MGGFVRLEIEIQSNERPIASIAVAERLLHDGANAFEKIVAHYGLGAIYRVAVRNDGPAPPGSQVGIPEKVLFNGNREADRKRAFDTVRPAAVIGITVVGIDYDTAARRRNRVIRSAQKRRGQCDAGRDGALYFFKSQK